MTGDEATAAQTEPSNGPDEPPQRKISVQKAKMEPEGIEVNQNHHGDLSSTTNPLTQKSNQENVNDEYAKNLLLRPLETDSAVALPAETTAETEAVLEAMAIEESHDVKEDKSDSDNDAEEILEESPDKRWSKRREKVKQRDVPGIDISYLAMDNETGNEVVWNEVQFSERKNFREQEEKIRAVFDDLTHLDHVNLVKFHKYWTDSKSEKPRIIFITEYMSSGSMSRFLQRARSSETLSNIRMWKKWTIQILSALNYLHSCDPPIAHANLSCNTIFIQQNGLIKIGCVAPNAIHHHVKTFRENIRNMHYIAPEYEYLNDVTTKADIYSFGICALEMATRGGLSTNGDSMASFSAENLKRIVDTLDNPSQRDFISLCLDPNPERRPTARELLFHPVLFEVHSLKLIAAHIMVSSKIYEHLSEDDLRVQDTSKIALSLRGHDFTYTDLDHIQTNKMDLDKFLEDVKNGIYPLFAFVQPVLKKAKSASRPLTTHEGNEEYSEEAKSIEARKNSADDTRGLIESMSSASIHKGDQGQKQLGERIDSGAHLSDLPTTMVTPASMDSITKIPVHVDSSPSSTITSNASCPSTIDHNSTIGSMQSSNGSEKPQGENRLIVQMKAGVKDKLLNMFLQLDDSMNRQLTTEVGLDDKAEDMVTELIIHGFICENDSDKVCALLTRVLEDFHEEQERSQEEKTPDGNDDRKKSNSPIPPRATPEDLTDDSSPPLSMIAPRSSTPPEAHE
ncbi:hypothetical protein FO519_002166 [Halicephalobus sp. NKZ332]|nr:hypothetical protein FO519_002166 [Halicephalobus sp. NKZ332]